MRRARVRRCDVVEIRRAQDQTVQDAGQQDQRGVRGAVLEEKLPNKAARMCVRPNPPAPAALVPGRSP